MGRAQSYVDTVLRRGSDPSSAVLAEIANACGYKLVLVKLDGSDSIDLDGK